MRQQRDTGADFADGEFNQNCSLRTVIFLKLKSRPGQLSLEKLLATMKKQLR